MMGIDYSELGLEENIERQLMDGGYIPRKLQGDALKQFQESAIDFEVLLSFWEKTQERELNRLKQIHGPFFEKRVLSRLDQELTRRGMIDCLRHGIQDRGVRLRLLFDQPRSTMNQTLVDNYDNNIFHVHRQVYYSARHNNSLDMMLSVNGLPIVIMELKNQLTGQTVEDAEKQFKITRDPREKLFRFKERTVVYFAVDTDEVSMTTKLAGNSTFFLPFNRGNNGGKGNPLVYNDYRSSYLWREVLAKDSLLDLLFRFVFVKKESIRDSTGEIIDSKEIVIFPRYHQMDVVRKIEADLNENAVGHNYLVQHSAGSGKTNSIAWLSHRLAKLHNTANEAVFDSIIVITDRRVLDAQLQDAIYQLEHETGFVAKIDEDSNQLAQAINDGTRIIITTLQKFPFIMDKVKEFERGTYGIIIDEAHSSQGGKASNAMTNILSDRTLEDAYEADKILEDELTSTEEKIVEYIEKSGNQDNISFFAFTATPKPKTIEQFGTTNKETGIPEAFHVYSMKQAIEEKFIFDVLRNYTTYDTFYKVAKSIQDDPEVSKKKATQQIARFVSLHPHNIEQKTAVMIEHFRQSSSHKIGGRAKAMLVTRSRLHAVRYKFAFDKYIKSQGYEDMNTLIAFSGTVHDDDREWTEAVMNQMPETELPEAFSTDEYQVLIVAEKYQTGFDEPLLHTMYVDKPLSGIKAVQTLSRLNRTCSGKEDTFVLDFVNDPEDIQDSFQAYYEVTGLSDVTDPNILYDLQHELNAIQVYAQHEVDAVNELEYGGNLDGKQAQQRLNPILDQAVDRFEKDLTKEVQDEFKSAATKFIRTYGFVLQIGPFTDIGLHKLYVYLNYLLKKLPRDISEQIFLADDIALEYYRNDKVFEGSLALETKGSTDLDPVSHAGGIAPEEETEALSSIIDRMNDLFGTEFDPQDKLSRDQLLEDMAQSEELREKALHNSLDNFSYSYENMFMDFLISRMTDKNFYMKMMENEDQRKFLMNEMKEEVYERLRS